MINVIPLYQKALPNSASLLTYSNLATAFFYLKRYAEACPDVREGREMNQNDPCCR